MLTRQLSRLVALQALILILGAYVRGEGMDDSTAANSGGKGTDVSTYKQPFAIPLAGAVPPVKPLSTVNDEFTIQKPAAPLGGFVMPEPKWVEWDVDDVLSASYVDPRLQLLQLAGNGEKQWAGRYEALPVPVIGQTMSYFLIARLFNAFVDNGGANFTDLLAGMLLCEDIAANPSTSGFVSIHQRFARIGDVMEGNIQATEWASFDGIALPDGEINCGWPLQFVRAQISTQVTAGPVYATTLTLTASADGIGWQPVSRYELDHPIRQVALAQRATGETPFSTYFDFIRHFEPGLPVNMAASFQQLGSV